MFKIFFVIYPLILLFSPQINALELNLPAVSQLPIHALESKQSKANVIAIVGGKGLRNALGKSNNFVSRIRNELHIAGLNYYLLPNPSSSKKAGYGFRASQKNSDRIFQLVKSIKQRNSLPIYLLGFSRGTVDAASYIKRYTTTVDGVILASGIYDNFSRKAEYYSMEKLFDRSYNNRILLVHHKHDRCAVSDPTKLNYFYSVLQSTNKTLLLIDGGDGNGRECGPFHHHGFEGVEQTVASKIAEWVVQ